jgi:hypothetical protein
MRAAHFVRGRAIRCAALFHMRNSCRSGDEMTKVKMKSAAGCPAADQSLKSVWMLITPRASR